MILSLKELPEASRAMRDGILSEASLGFAIGSVLSVAAADFSVGEKAERKALGDVLKLPLRAGGLNYYAIAQITQTIEGHYLDRWATAVAANPDIKAERIARAVASHLLDLGFNADYLHRWWKYRIAYQTPRRPLHDLIAEAHNLASTAPREFEVMVAFDKVPPAKFGRPAGWINSAAVVTWLKSQHFSTANVKQIGGIIFRIDARDPQAAADTVIETVDNLLARARVATTSDMRCFPSLWIAGETTTIPFARRTPGLDLGALIRENVVYTRSGPEDVIDAAFEMLALLQTGSPIAAIAAGWAAIEAILGEPDDRGGAADRLATIIACSFPRAELTALSYVLAREDPAMKIQLTGVTENLSRARCVAQAILSNQPLSLATWSDRATLERMRAVLVNPAEALLDIRKYVQASLRRVYRQRNLVLHGGKTNAVALRACLRTASPLIGAGMDRVAHAHYVERLPPVALAARAQVALATTASRSPIDCLNLLG